MESQEYMVAGWGKTTNDPLLGQKDFTELGVSIRTLQRLSVPEVPFAKCTAIFPFVTDKQFCFGGLLGEFVIDISGQMVAKKDLLG